jgi:hypothetical protein
MKTIRLLAVMVALAVVILQVSAQQRPTGTPPSTTPNGPFVRSNATRKIAAHTYQPVADVLSFISTSSVTKVG